MAVNIPAAMRRRQTNSTSRGLIWLKGIVRLRTLVILLVLLLACVVVATKATPRKLRKPRRRTPDEQLNVRVPTPLMDSFRDVLAWFEKSNTRGVVEAIEITMLQRLLVLLNYEPFVAELKRDRPEMDIEEQRRQVENDHAAAAWRAYALPMEGTSIPPPPPPPESPSARRAVSGGSAGTTR